MKIAIAGYGVEGRASYQYWRDRAELTIADERDQVPGLPEDVPTILGEGALSKLDGFDMVVRTASLAPRKIKTNGKIWSATNEFFQKCPAPIIGVTGTKGKGTTSSLIASMLQSAGRTVHLVGNIGQPALEVLPDIAADDVVVYELSSFQLWDIEKSPHVAVVLMIEPDHLDVHESFEEYIEAKQGITKHQQAYDTVIYHSKNQWSQDIAACSLAENRVTFPCDIGQLADSLMLPGEHNLDNAAAAIAAARQFTDDEKAIARGIAAFQGLPHRLKLVGEVAGVRYYDDSIATTPGSAIAAIKAFKEPKIIILGGSDKGADYTEVVALCQKTASRVIAIGETGVAIEKLCADREVDCDYVDSLETAVALSYKSAKAGDVVILSPASASFDMFDSYVDRGNQFTMAVNQLADSLPVDQ